MKSNKYARACILNYPACAVLYCHLWHVRFYNIFPRYFINGTIKCVFVFIYKFYLKYFSF
jgi:hypothetical protein